MDTGLAMPREFIDPVTKNLLLLPVDLVIDGDITMTCNERCILEHLYNNGNIGKGYVVPNYTLRKTIMDWLDQHDIALNSDIDYVIDKLPITHNENIMRTVLHKCVSNWIQLHHKNIHVKSINYIVDDIVNFTGFDKLYDLVKDDDKLTQVLNMSCKICTMPISYSV